MNNTKQEMLDKIAKLLNMGKGDANSNEAKSALAMASKLMAKHRITETELDLETDSLLKDVMEFDMIDKGGAITWIVYVCSNLCSTFDCKMVYNSGVGTVTFLGTESDVETVSYFADIVINHIEEGCWDSYPNERNWRKRREIGTAASYVIQDRLAEMKREMDKHMQAGVSERGLVIVKDARIKEAFTQEFPHLGKGNLKNSNVSKKCSAIGTALGKSAPLNKGLNQGNQHAIA